MIRKKPAPHLMRGGYRFSLATNAERVCAEIMFKQKIERDDDSKKSHRALGATITPDAAKACAVDFDILRQRGSGCRDRLGDAIGSTAHGLFVGVERSLG